jgi:hypothetical protein
VLRLAAIAIILLTLAPAASAQRAKSRRATPPAPGKEAQAKEAQTKETQTKDAKTKKSAEKAVKVTAKDVADSRANLVAATEAYKDSLEKLQKMYADEVERAEELVKKRKQLFEAGIIAKRELDESEMALAEARTKIDDARQRVKEADQLIAEAAALDQLAKLPPVTAGSYTSNLRMIRFAGAGRWALGDVGKVDGYFRARFRKGLPISAVGQSATHDRLGFDHRESVDVALHPDSDEGRDLMAYLRSQGIPFIAFRGAVAGSATGAHIHIGRPSRRVSPVLGR